MKSAKLSQAAEEKVARIIKIVESTLESEDNADVEVFFKGDDNAAAKIHKKWSAGANEVEDILRGLPRDWPGCSGFVSGVRGYLKYYRARIEFYPAWRSFVANYDPGDPKGLDRQVEFVKKNRETERKGKAELAKAHEVLMRQVHGVE